MSLSDEHDAIKPTNIIDALIKNQMEENVFVRHYEDTRFKITQMTITLSGLLIGALRFGTPQPHTTRLLGVFIIILGVLGALISAKYTERADRHATLSRAYRRAVSDLIGQVGMTDLEKIHQDAAVKHRKARTLTGRLHDVRARLFWIGIHVCMIILGVIVSVS